MTHGGTGQPYLGTFQRVILELSTVLYFVSKNCAIPLVQQYIYHLVGRKYGLSNNERSSQLFSWEPAQCDGGNCTFEDSFSSETVLRNKVNEEASRIVLYITIAELLPAAFSVLFLGWLSDVLKKRRFMMWLACLGNSLYALGFVLPMYISRGDIDSPSTLPLFITACIISGLTGSIPGFFSGNASYISHSDSVERRTLRLAFVELTVGVTFGAGNMVIGLWIHFAGTYIQPLWFIAISSFWSFFLILVLLKEPVRDPGAQPSSSHLKNIKLVGKVFGCSTTPQRKLWAIFLAFQIYVFVQQGQERTYVLLLQSSPLYWNATKIGLFLFLLYTLSGIGSYPGVPLLHLVCGDVSIAILAVISKGLGSMMLAFAKTDAVVYFSGVVQLFHLLPFAVARSLASKQVSVDNQGVVYALIHSVQAMVGFLGPVAHNAVFVASNQFMPGLTFLISASLLLPSLILLGYCKYLEKTDEGDLKQSPAEELLLSPDAESEG